MGGTTSITKAVVIACSPELAFDFIADPANWPQWAVGTVLSAKYLDGEWWIVQMPSGSGRLRIRSNREQGILDHDLITQSTRWRVQARVVSIRGGAEFIITFFKPEGMPEQAFLDRLGQVDHQLAVLKQTLEGGRQQHVA